MIKNKTKILIIALVLFGALASFFGTTLCLKEKTTAITHHILGEENIGDAAFLGEDLLVGTAMIGEQNRIFSLAPDHSERFSMNLESYVRKIKIFGQVAAVILENKKVLFLNSLGEQLSENTFLYPITDLDFHEERKLFVALGSVGQANSALFIIPDFSVHINHDTNSAMVVKSTVFPIGVGITDQGSVLFAGSNSRVYRCVTSNSSGKTEFTGSVVSVLETRFTQNSFAVIKNRLALGFVNGVVDIFSENTQNGQEEYTLNCSHVLGKQEVMLAYLRNDSDLFAALNRDGSIGFYHAQSGELVSNGKVETQCERFSLSENGNASLLKNGILTFADSQLIGVANVFSILFYPALILFLCAIAFLTYGILNSIKRTTESVNSALKLLKHDLWRDKKCYLMLLPAFTFLSLFVFYPILQGFLIAFQNYIPGVKAEFVGLQNFVTVFHNQYFWGSMKNMLLFLVTDLVKAIVPPLIIAECIIAVASKKSQYAARVMMYIPGILPGLAGLLIWKTGILGADGVLSQLFGAIGFDQLAHFNWLGHDATAIWGLIFIGFPYVGGYIIMYGALLSIPTEYYDAAKMDGFSWFKRILWIDIPLIRPQLKYIFVLNFIGSIQDFQRVYMTTGGTYNTNIPALELFYNINTFNNYGAAAAMGLLLFTVIFVASIFNLKIKSED